VERFVSPNPIASVVIPTRNRPNLVIRAIKSALAQTLSAIDVIVVIDGPEQNGNATADAVAAINDRRVTTIQLPFSVGGSEARNVGIRISKAEFIALLDDDDEWSPNKLSRQLELVKQSTGRFMVATCRLIARRPASDEIWPARQIGPFESMSEYLLCRENSIRQGEGFIQTSTLFVPRDLLLEIPFNPALSRHQDWDWLIRASVHPGVEFVWAWEPLVVYHIDTARKSISGDPAPGASESWIIGNRLVTPKARAYFYATQIAARCKTPATFWNVFRNTLRHPRAFLIAMGLALTPRSLVNFLRPRSVLNHA